MSSATLTISSSVHDYVVEEFTSMTSALESVTGREKAVFLVDRNLAALYATELQATIQTEKIVYAEASENQKALESLAPLVVEILRREIKRDGVIVVVGGGTVQDIGCFIASTLFRGVRWELVPTTLLAQADSCIGSKSSINVGRYKNQVGTFYPPHRVMMVPSVLATLPWDEVRSGLGEIIKLQLLAGEEGFRSLMSDLQRSGADRETISRWVWRSLAVKKAYIEVDERDRGIRNLLNYGHTFGHAYESATQYRIPHGIAVTLGMLTATYLSARLGLVGFAHYSELRELLAPWHEPYAQLLQEVSHDKILEAIKLDKKNTGAALNCILTCGFGRMEKRPVALSADVMPAVDDFLLSMAAAN